MKRTFVIFIVLLMACVPVFSQKKDTYRVRTVVIDPGHGGAKPGAQGKQTQEKVITLAVAKKFGKLIEDNYPDVKVIYTRTSDADISLAERAHIANRNKADLFISIHANSHPTSAPTGVETFVMGLSESKANLEVAKKENADILLEADYKSNADYKGFDPNSPESYVMLAMFQNAFIDKSLNLAQAIQTQYKQNLKTINRGVKQAELYVLYKTTCPSVLTEIGFISNPTEESFMLSEEGQARIAVCLFTAFMNYKSTEEGTNKIANPVYNIKGYVAPAAKAEPPKTEAPAVAEAVKEEPKPAPAVKEESKTAPAAKEETKPAPTVKEEPKPAPAVKEEPKPASEAVRPATPAEAPKPVVTPAEKPTPAVALPAVQAQPAQEPAAQTLAAPRHSAQADAPLYYTVQFMLHPVLFKAGDAALGGISDFQTQKRDNNYVYTTGRFLTSKEASAYCDQVKQNTPFKDAWVTRHKAPAAPTEATPATAQNATAAPAATQPAETKPTTEKKAPETKPTTEKKAPEAKPAAGSVTYRIQFCTANRRMKAGDPDLQGIKDFHIAPSGSLFVYTAGNYTTLNAARQRLQQIRTTTRFKDAFVVALYRGERISLEKAAQIEKKTK